jgi:hypothetical protein
MAGWLGLLKVVPWGDVMSNAPKIAEGAKSLWSAVAKKVRPGDETTAESAVSASDTPLSTRIAALEESQRELRAQLTTSSDLIRSLAEQNAQLVVRLDALRSRLRWLTLGTAVVLVAAAVTWVLRT